MSAEQLPPSAKFTLHTVERHEPVSRQDLLEETDLPERTLDRALDRLQNGDYVVTDRDTRDLRQIVVTTADTRTITPSRD